MPNLYAKNAKKLIEYIYANVLDGSVFQKEQCRQCLAGMSPAERLPVVLRAQAFVLSSVAQFALKNIELQHKIPRNESSTASFAQLFLKIDFLQKLDHMMHNVQMDDMPLQEMSFLFALNMCSAQIMAEQVGEWLPGIDWKQKSS